MVLFLDLDDEPAADQLSGDCSTHAYDRLKTQLRGPLLRAGNTNDARGLDTCERPSRCSPGTAKVEEEDERPNPNLNGFSAALSCYPVVASLAHNLDLNTLHDLSRTCRQFRANLLQYRTQLIAQSLRCSKENDAKNASLASRYRESHAAWHSNGSFANISRITSGKVGKCARDKVGECRRCGTVVCRNCIAKPPPIPALKDRHRRLCKACIRAPLTRLTQMLRHLDGDDLALHRTASPSSSTSSSPARPSRLPTPPVEELPSRPGSICSIEDSEPAFTASAFALDPCYCPDEVWLCQPCGQSLRVHDTDYRRGWVWRARYSTYLGGLGTGIGEGNEGVQCGRRSACCAAKIEEQEVECDAEAMRAMEEETEGLISLGRSWEGGGFAVQEIEGVGGGQFKMKRKKLVLLGKRVQECEDERSGLRSYLSREVEQQVRSWCNWCERVIPSKTDLEVKS